MGKISKNDGFKTPEGYFEGLTERLLEKMKDESAEIPKSDGFQVPEGYFDAVDKEILSKLDQPESRVVRLYPYKKLLYTAVSVAAVVLIFIGLQWQGDQSITFDDLANMELAEYFEDNTTGLSSYEIAEVFTVEDLEVTDILEEEWSEENIADYLDDTLDDIDVIDDIDELNLNDNE